MDPQLKLFTHINGNPGARFNATIINEHTSGFVETIGQFDCTLELFNLSPDHCIIEWDIIGYDTEHIGIELEGNRVTGYDGVFTLPSEIIRFLEMLNFDLSEITNPIYTDFQP